MRIWTSVAILALVLAVSGFSYSSFTSGTPVETARVREMAIREYIDEEAKTRLNETYLITMPYNGRIEAIDLREGVRVKKGDAVARIVPLDVQLNLDAATAAVERLEASIRESEDVSVESTGLQQALQFVESIARTVEAAGARVKAGEAKLAYSEKNLGRVQKTYEKKAKSEDELDQAQLAKVQSTVDYQQDVLVERAMEAMQAATVLMPTAVRQYIQRKSLSTDVLKKQLAEAKINLQQAQNESQRGTMISPVDGIVLERLVSNERHLAAGTVLLRIGRWEDLEVEADVLSQEVVRVKPANPIEVTGPAIGDKPAHAVVDRVYPAGFTKISSLGVEQQRVKVVMKFSSEDMQRLRQERDLGVDYRVRVRIYTAQKNRAAVVPRSALFRGPDGGWRTFAVRNGRASLTVVEVGLNNDEHAEVIRGLSVGDEVILTPESKLADGEAVKPIVVETRIDADHRSASSG